MMPRQIPVFSKDLTERRRKKGISLSEIAGATKISVRYLQAIEWGEFRKLPGGVYSVNYIRQYARAIEFDENDLVAYYHEVAPPEEQPIFEPPAPDPWIYRFRERMRSLFAAGGRPAIASEAQERRV